MSNPRDRPPPFFAYPPSKFPMTMRIFSGKDGSVLWEKTIEKPEPTLAIEIPGYAGTEHVPVTVRIDFADGTTEGPT